jgi:DNA-nicking Smr family endonuclease
VPVHDGWAVTQSGGKGGKGGGQRGGPGGTSKTDREALERAFADVKPLGAKTKKRVMPAPQSGPAPAGGPRQAPREPLRVEREGNGIVLGRRRSAHASILDALEDPRLEVEAECDLHGHRVREAEREVHRFVRDSQQNGKRWVLIIVGKGLHSPDGKGTLKANVVEALSKRAPARFVLAFRTAPRHLGGTGALVARLVDRL